MDADVREADALRDAFRSDVEAPLRTIHRLDPRTRLLFEGPIVGALLRLATPNVLAMFVQAAVGLIETYFVAKRGTDFRIQLCEGPGENFSFARGLAERAFVSQRA